MTAAIKTAEELEKMRKAGRLAAEVLEMIEPKVEVGMTTGDIDRICHQYITEVQDAIPSTLNYNGFPKSICTSVNHVVCHGIPNDEKVLKNGDIINVDVTLIKDEYHGDTSKTFIVGTGSVMAQRLTAAAKESMYRGIRQVKPGATLGDIGHVIQTYAEKNRYSIVREYCGHGIGKIFHDEPQVLHYGKPGTGLELQEGMVFTIEPMINAGKAHNKVLPDGWTVVTKDRKLSAQWEHTLAVTADGYEVLTARQEESDLY